MSLKAEIITMIRENGPMDTGAFMGLALSHPKYGYYMTRDPFGQDGDFTTAPEISQMFGELLGAWAADCWLKLGQPERFYFLECGPGRGTLMADALRAVKAVPGFLSAAQIRLIEISPVLKQKQRETLSGYGASWTSSIDEIEDDAPVIMIANEFLDALPVRQFRFHDNAWQERVIGLSPDDELQFGFVPAPGIELPQTEEGTIIEYSPARESFVRSIAQRITAQKGAALFIDYGTEKQGIGDTLQAVKDHKYVDVLESPGEADMTSHVDFVRLKRITEQEKVTVYGPVPQGGFLYALGIKERAQILQQRASAKQRMDIENALKRLTDKDEMGTLFKVMVISSGLTSGPAGF